MIDIQNEAKAHLEELDYENPEDIEKIYFYKSIIDTTEGVMIYARRMADYLCGAGGEGNQSKTKGRAFENL